MPARSDPWPATWTPKLERLIKRVAPGRGGGLGGSPTLDDLILRGGPWIDVRAYGAIGDGSTDDTAAIQNVINAASAAGGGTVHFPIGTYKTTARLDGSSYIHFAGEDKTKSIINGAHTGTAVLSLKGDTHCTMSNLCIQGDASTIPKTGLTLGRSSAGTAGYHYFENIRVQGSFTEAAVYSIASEENVWDHCYLTVHAGTAAYAFYTSQSDSLSIESLTGSTNLVNTFIGCQFFNHAGETDASALYIQGGVSTGAWTFINCYFVSPDNAYITIDTGTVDGGAIAGPITFLNCGGEEDGDAAGVSYGFHFTVTGTEAINEVSIINSAITGLSGGTPFTVYSEDNITLNNFYYTDSDDADLSLYDVINSEIRSTAGNITIRGDSINNNVTYDPGSYTYAVTGELAGGIVQTAAGKVGFGDTAGEYLNGNRTIANIVGSGQSYWLDGVNDKVDLGTMAASDLDMGIHDFSYIFTFIQRDTATSPLLGVWEDADNRFYIRLLSGQQPIMVGEDANVLLFSYQTTDTTAVPLNVWTTLALVADRDDAMYMYIDGEGQTLTEATAMSAADLNVNSTAALGYYSVGSEYGNFEISRCLAFNKALTETEVEQYSAGGSIPYKYIGASQTEQTAGTLTFGKAYRINDWITNDDFTNIGGTNADGSEFVATGTTPTTWTNSSTVVPIGAVLQLEPDSITPNDWIDKSGNTLHGAVLGAVATNLPIGKEILLSVTTISFGANGTTDLYDGLTPGRFGLTKAVIVAGADAGATTTITIGADGTETDFLGTQTLSNLDAANDSVILMPVPNATPVKTKSYAAGTNIEAVVANQSGGATNTLYLFGFLY